MSTLRALRRRIRSVQNTQQITKAMEMVAAAKLRRAQNRALAARPYAAKITEMLGNLAGAASELDHPLFKAREVKTTALVLVTSDRGLCGAYNANLLRATEHRMRAARPGSLALVLVGKKGRDYFRRRKYPVLATHTPLPPEASLGFARELTQDLIARFTSGEVDRVELMFTHFVTALNRRVLVEPFLPVGTERTGARPSGGAVIFEPDAESLFAELLPRYATAKLFAALADALASEHSARMIAMGAARKNAGELIDLLTLRRNRLRQAAITKELLDIVGGAEALK
ncbi:MAG TPA: ATP synthase F1 subunit gamma [Candidatus Eisenbacteria bacterium]|jgi:F-type H+-transporting ATPase subunit gamma